jgi:hypothetical protein
MDFRVKLIPLVIGAVLFVVGWQEWSLAKKARGQPQVMPASQLAANGPGPNAHIELTHFDVAGDSLVYQAKQKRFGGGEGDWQKVWVPVIPMDGGPMGMMGMPNAAGPIRIILTTRKAKDINQLNALLQSKADPMVGVRMRGLVVNEIERLGGEEKRLLSEAYPSIDFAHCYIFEIDRKPKGAGDVLGFMGGGGMLALAGIAWLVAGAKA